MSLKLGNITRITLGVQGETGANPIRIDVSEWLEEYPDGTISLYNLRHGTEQAYPTGATVDPETGILTWTPTSADTEYDGAGLCQVRLTDDGIVKKSVNIPTKVFPALPGTTSEEPPAEYQAWVDIVEGYKDAAHQSKEAAEDAQEAAEDAQEAAEDAQEAAENAQEAAETAQEAAETAQEAAETAQEAAETAQGKAETAQGKAETAQGAAEAAQTAAEAARDEILELTADAEGLPEGRNPTAAYDPTTGNMHFGIPAGAKGDKGDKGDGLIVLGYFETLAALEASITDPDAGDAYGVGTAEPYEIYIWDGIDLEWKDNGTIQGAKGDKGDKGDQGNPGPAGPGVATGGTTGQVLRKKSNSNYDTEWDTFTVSDVDGLEVALFDKVDKEDGKGLSTNDFDNAALAIVEAVPDALDGKVDVEAGKGLSTNDFTTEEQTKLAGIEEQANKTVVENVLTSTSTTNALSAAQGKALSDTIAKFTNGGNTAINNFDCNTASEGEYWLGTGIVNGPSGIDWAHLSCRTDSSGFKYQLFYRSGGSNFFYRAYNGTAWSDWGRVILDINTDRLVYKWTQAWDTTLTFTLPQLGEMILFSSLGSWQVWFSGSISNPVVSSPIRLGGTNADPVITRNGLSITITMPTQSTIIAVLFTL